MHIDEIKFLVILKMENSLGQSANADAIEYAGRSRGANEIIRIIIFHCAKCIRLKSVSEFHAKFKIRSPQVDISLTVDTI